MWLFLDQKYSHQPASYPWSHSMRDKADAKLTVRHQAISFASAIAILFHVAAGSDLEPIADNQQSTPNLATEPS
jgi:hypothetical protein